jgi:glycosyltransferase involved in cell wall biosynthesis
VQVGISFLRSLFSAIPLELRLFQNRRLALYIKEFLVKNSSYTPIFFTLRSWQIALILPPQSYIVDFVDSYALNYSRRTSPRALGIFYKLQAMLYLHIEKTLSLNSKAAFVVSHVDKDYIGVPKIDVVPNGVSNSLHSVDLTAKSHPNSLSFSLGFIGNLNYRPNKVSIRRFVMAALPIIISKADNIKLYIAGSGAKGLGLSPGKHLTMLGRVNCQFHFMASMDIIVIPMYEGSGMQNKLLEAMLLGKPIVTTAIASEPLRLQHNIHAMIAYTDQELADYVLCLVENHELRRYLGINAKHLAINSFSWSSSYDKFASKVIF